MSPSESQRVLRVQSVLFRQQQAQLWRLLRGLAAAAHKVVDVGLVGSVEWALGDSSPVPCFTERDARTMLELLEGPLADVTYTHFGANLGSSGGQNKLAEGHPSDLLLILNPDTYPSPTALVELVKALEDPQVGLVEARQIPLEHPRDYDLVTGETSWVSGFCMLARRAVFDELGGFDSEHFLLHCDDVDLSWRARKAGYKVVIAPYATVFHDKRPTPDAAWPAPDYEIYHAAFGRLMLATRWDRPDIVEETITSIEADTSGARQDALADFRLRLASGRVPDPEPDSHEVAQFIDGEYAVHRF